MRRLSRLVALLSLEFAASAFAAEGAPPAGAPGIPFDPKAARDLATKVLDDVRGERARSLYVLSIPEDDPVPPAPGSEAVLIGGYISHYVVAVRWTGEAVESRYLSMSRTWFYNPHGERWSSRSVPVPPEEFARRWGAARLVIGATTWRRAPRNPDLPSGSSSGVATHTPDSWVRIRDPAVRAPLYFDNDKHFHRDDEGVPNFDAVRCAALFRLFADLVEVPTRVDVPTRRNRDREPGTPLPVDAWRPFLRENLERYCASPLRVGEDDAPLPDLSLLLVEVCLRALSEAGETTDRSLLDRVDARLRRGLEGAKFEDIDLMLARREIPLTRARIRFRWEWDAAEAAKAIHENPRERHAQNDLAAWIRDRFHEKDPKGYRDLLLADLRSKERLLLLETIREVGRRLPSEASTLLGPFKADGDEEIREAVEDALKPPK